MTQLSTLSTTGNSIDIKAEYDIITFLSEQTQCHLGIFQFTTVIEIKHRYDRGEFQLIGFKESPGLESLAERPRLSWMVAHGVEGIERPDREAAACPRIWGRSRAESVLHWRKGGGSSSGGCPWSGPHADGKGWNLGIVGQGGS